MSGKEIAFKTPARKSDAAADDLHRPGTALPPGPDRDGLETTAAGREKGRMPTEQALRGKR